MAATRIMAVHAGKSGSAQKVVSRVIDYVVNPEKTDNKQLVSSYHCNPSIAGTDLSFCAVSIFGIQDGRKEKMKLRHITSGSPLFPVRTHRRKQSARL